MKNWDVSKHEVQFFAVGGKKGLLSRLINLKLICLQVSLRDLFCQLSSFYHKISVMEAFVLWRLSTSVRVWQDSHSTPRRKFLGEFSLALYLLFLLYLLSSRLIPVNSFTFKSIGLYKKIIIYMILGVL